MFHIVVELLSIFYKLYKKPFSWDHCLVKQRVCVHGKSNCVGMCVQYVYRHAVFVLYFADFSTNEY